MNNKGKSVNRSIITCTTKLLSSQSIKNNNRLVGDVPYAITDADVMFDTHSRCSRLKHNSLTARVCCERMDLVDGR